MDLSELNDDGSEMAAPLIPNCAASTSDGDAHQPQAPEQHRDQCTSVNEPSLESCCWWMLGSWILLVIDGVRLVLFVLALLPGYVRFFWYYMVTAKRKVARYDKASCRQSLDVFLADDQASREYSTHSSGISVVNAASLLEDDVPAPSSCPLLSCVDDTSPGHHGPCRRPVVVFFPGGAWLIGHKMWGTLTARVLQRFGVVTVLADYRNYPFGNVKDMVEDTSNAIQWTFDHIHEYGGDPQRIIVMGQSAGGSLCTTAVLRRALEVQRQVDENGQSINEEGNASLSWNPSDLSGLISVSAPYSFEQMVGTFHRHGLSRGFMERMLPSQKRDEFDPFALLRQLHAALDGHCDAGSPPSILPPIRIWHGKSDKTVNWQMAQDFFNAFVGRGQGELVKHYFCDAWTHTSPILEDPMIGCHDFHLLVVTTVQEWTTPDEEQEGDVFAGVYWDDSDPVLRPLVPCFPQKCSDIAQFFMPF